MACQTAVVWGHQIPLIATLSGYSNWSGKGLCLHGGNNSIPLGHTNHLCRGLAAFTQEKYEWNQRGLPQKCHQTKNAQDIPRQPFVRRIHSTLKELHWKSVTPSWQLWRLHSLVHPRATTKLRFSANWHSINDFKTFSWKQIRDTKCHGSALPECVGEEECFIWIPITLWNSVLM